MAYTATVGLGKDVIYTQYAWIGIYAAATMVILLITATARRTYNALRFNREQRYLANVERMFSLAIQSMALVLLTVLYVYLNVELEIVLYLALSAFVIIKFVEICKVYSIFFKKKRAYFKFFLYLCTLEAIPLYILIECYDSLANILKTNI